MFYSHFFNTFSQDAPKKMRAYFERGRRISGRGKRSENMKSKVFRTLEGEQINHGMLIIAEATISPQTYSLQREGNGGVIPGVPASVALADEGMKPSMRGRGTQGGSDRMGSIHQCELEDQHRHRGGKTSPCHVLVVARRARPDQGRQPVPVPVATMSTACGSRD